MLQFTAGSEGGENGNGCTEDRRAIKNVVGEEINR